MYIFPFVIIFLVLCKKTTGNKIFHHLILIFFVLFSSLRDGIGYDYSSYIRRIHDMPHFNQLFLGKEFFSYLLLWASHYFQNPQIFFSINAIIANVLIFFTIFEYSDNPSKSIWIYLTFPMFFLNSLSIVRNFTAFSIIFFSQRFIFAKEPKKFFYSVFIAGMFHFSAFFVFPIYWLDDLKLNWKKKISSIIVVFSSIPILRLISKTFFPVYSVYFEINDQLKAGRGTLLILISVLIASAYYWEKLIEINRRNNFYLNALFYSVIIFIGYYKFGHISFRLTEYLYIFIIILIPSIFNLVVGSIVNRFDRYENFITLCGNLAFYLFFFVMYSYLIKVGGTAYYPYKWRIFKMFDHNYYVPFIQLIPIRVYF